MSGDVPERGRLTDALIAHLEGYTPLSDAGVLVGDGTAPDGAGWALQPGESDFVASVTVSTGQAVPSPAAETVRRTESSWRALYGLRSVGGARKQADFAADKVREAFQAFPTGPIAGYEAWTVQQVLFARLAAIRPQVNGDVTQFLADDLAEIWITRSAR